MQIDWKNIEEQDYKLLYDWLTEQDKHNLCMTEKNWKQTAYDIADCFKAMDNAEFKNIMGYVNGRPVVAVMFGIEHGGVLNLYNIVVNPKCRNVGVAKNTILKFLQNEKALNLIENYSKVVASTLPDNFDAINLFQSLDFENLGFNGEYLVFEKNTKKHIEMVK